MKRLYRITSIIVLTCFLFNTALYEFSLGSSVTYQPNGYNLAASSKLDDLVGIEHKDIGRIEIALQAKLKSIAGKDGSLPKSVDEFKRTLTAWEAREETKFNPARMEFEDTQLFLHEITSIEEALFCVKCRITDEKALKKTRTYYAVFSPILDKDGGFHIETYTEKEWKEGIERFIKTVKAVPVRKLQKPKDVEKKRSRHTRPGKSPEDAKRIIMGEDSLQSGVFDLNDYYNVYIAVAYKYDFELPAPNWKRTFQRDLDALVEQGFLIRGPSPCTYEMSESGRTEIKIEDTVEDVFAETITIEQFEDFLATITDSKAIEEVHVRIMEQFEQIREGEPRLLKEILDKPEFKIMMALKARLTELRGREEVDSRREDLSHEPTADEIIKFIKDVLTGHRTVVQLRNLLKQVTNEEVLMDVKDRVYQTFPDTRRYGEIKFGDLLSIIGVKLAVRDRINGLREQPDLLKDRAASTSMDLYIASLEMIAKTTDLKEAEILARFGLAIAGYEENEQFIELNSIAFEIPGPGTVRNVLFANAAILALGRQYKNQISPIKGFVEHVENRRDLIPAAVGCITLLVYGGNDVRNEAEYVDKRELLRNLRNWSRTALAENEYLITAIISTGLVLAGHREEIQLLETMLNRIETRAKLIKGQDKSLLLKEQLAETIIRAGLLIIGHNENEQIEKLSYIAGFAAIPKGNMVRHAAVANLALLAHAKKEQEIESSIERARIDAEEAALGTKEIMPIPTHPDKRYTLLVDNSLHKNNDEYTADIKGYVTADGRYVGARERFNLERVDTSNIDNILEHVKHPERTVVHISGELNDKDIAKLKERAPGIRVIRVDIATKDFKYVLDDNTRRDYRFDLYAKMLVARRITEEDIKEENSIYRTLSFFLNTHYKDGKENIAKSYIEAIVNDNISFIIKHNLSYRPAERWRRPSHHQVAVFLISA